MKRYRGNLDNLLKKHGAKKITDNEIVETIFVLYHIKVKPRLHIEITVEHHPEEEDEVIFKLVLLYKFIPLSIVSNKDLNHLIKIIG